MVFMVIPAKVEVEIKLTVKTTLTRPIGEPLDAGLPNSIIEIQEKIVKALLDAGLGYPYITQASSKQVKNTDKPMIDRWSTVENV